MRESVKWFAEQMEKKLQQHDDRDGWEDEKYVWLFNRGELCHDACGQGEEREAMNKRNRMTEEKVAEAIEKEWAVRIVKQPGGAGYILVSVPPPSGDKIAEILRSRMRTPPGASFPLPDYGLPVWAMRRPTKVEPGRRVCCI